MRRRCNGAPTGWLGGVILIALGIGMLLACLFPNCVFFVGVLLLIAGIWLINQNGKYR